MILAGFRHRPGVHCGSTALADARRARGLALVAETEPEGLVEVPLADLWGIARHERRFFEEVAAVGP